MSNELATQSPTACEKVTTRLRPRYNVSEDKDAYTIDVTMPGVGKEDTVISLQDNELLIEGKRTAALPVDARWLHREISEADYHLRLQLNIDIDADGITANAEDGILKIHLPIAEAAKPRSIRIS
ncbi:MAG: Hsp20/alpha crystallin family protein [Puniceicoccaceae bacterium]